MWVRIAPVRFDLSLAETVIKLTNEVIIPLFRSQPGFVRYQAGLDRKLGTGVSLTFWETREQAQSLSDAFHAIAPQLQAATLEIGAAAIYEILVEG
jgi:hypothetical protein